MYRGTTPTIEIKVRGYDNLIEAKQIEIILKNDHQIIERYKENVSIVDNILSFKLTQVETLNMSARRKVWLQIRIMTSDGTVIACDAKSIVVKDILKDEVLV